MRGFTNPYVKFRTLWFFCSLMTSALQNGRGSSRFCYAGLWEQQTRSALWLPALSSLFSCLSSPGGKAGFSIWIVTVSSGFVEVLVSCWFSLLPYSFWHNNLCTLLCESSAWRGIPSNRSAPKCSYVLQLPGECICNLQMLPFKMTFLPKDCPGAYTPCLFTHK